MLDVLNFSASDGLTGTGESGGLPADPGHGGLRHQHRLLVRQQLDAIWESHVLHHHRQLLGLGVVLEDAEDETACVREPLPGF